MVANHYLRNNHFAVLTFINSIVAIFMALFIDHFVIRKLSWTVSELAFKFELAKV